MTDYLGGRPSYIGPHTAAALSRDNRSVNLCETLRWSRLNCEALDVGGSPPGEVPGRGCSRSHDVGVEDHDVGALGVGTT